MSTELPKELRNAAKKEFKTMDIEIMSWIDFISGVEWLYSHLLSQGMEEWNEKQVELEWMRIWKEEELNDEDFITPGYHGYDNGILQLVRWAHQQSAARVAVAESERKFWQSEAEGFAELHDKKQERITDLEIEVNNQAGHIECLSGYNESLKTQVTELEAEVARLRERGE